MAVYENGSRAIVMFYDGAIRLHIVDAEKRGVIMDIAACIHALFSTFSLGASSSKTSAPHRVVCDCRTLKQEQLNNGNL